MRASAAIPIEARGPGRPRDEEARRRILDATIQLLEEVGFNNATIDAIAECAGASKATIYRWWPNKALLFVDAFCDAVATEIPFPDTGDFREDVRLQLRNFTRILTGSKGRILAAFVAAAQEDKVLAEALREHWIGARRREGRKVLDRHRKNGEMKDLDLDLVFDFLYAPLYYRLLTGYGPLTPAYADALAAVAIDGLKRRSK